MNTNPVMRIKFSKTHLALLLIILLAFVLRVYRLDFFSLRGDESFTVLFVEKPLAQMWQETLTVEPNPPILYFLLRGWIALAGDGEFVNRFFSLWFGVLCVPLVYRLSKEIFSRLRLHPAVSLVAALLLALNPYQIWHSQDVRNYTLWMAASLLALIPFWLWYRTERRDNASLKYLGLFVLAELFALYIHYYETFTLLALNLFVFATLWRDWRKVAQCLGAQVVLALLYLPYPLILSNRVSAYGEGSGRQGVALWDIFRETFTSFNLSDTLDPIWRNGLWIPLALLALGALIYLFTRDWRRGLFFLLYAAVPTLSVFALNLFRPLYLERYLNGIAPAYYLLLALGIVTLANLLANWLTRLRRPSSVPGPSSVVRRSSSVAVLLIPFVLIAFLALSTYWTNPAYAKSPDWRGLARTINTNALPQDLIVQNFPETSLVYYLQRTPAPNLKQPLPLVVYPETFLPDTKTTQQLNAMNANYQRVWFIPAAPDVWDPDQFVEQWLAHRDDQLQTWDLGDLGLNLYATPSQYLNTMQRVGVTFGDRYTLLGYRTQQMGDTLRIVLYWRALANPDTQDKTFIQLLSNIDQGETGPVLEEDEDYPEHPVYPTTGWRKNEIVVDQHDISNTSGATAFRLSFLHITNPVSLSKNKWLALPVIP